MKNKLRLSLTFSFFMLGLAFSLIVQALQQQADAATSTRDYQGGTQTSVFKNYTYVAWFSNKSGNWEVLFRASSDGGNIFGDIINLSNSPTSDSVDVNISSDENIVAVSWWERNQTSDEPVLRISTDNGKTFQPFLKLAANGTLW